MRFLFLFLTLVLSDARADCSLCKSLQEEVETLHQEIIRTKNELDAQNAEAKKIGAQESAKKMRMTSSLFVLAANHETAQNREIIAKKKRDLQCRGCGGTAKAKTNTAPLKNHPPN